MPLKLLYNVTTHQSQTSKEVIQTKQWVHTLQWNQKLTNHKRKEYMKLQEQQTSYLCLELKTTLNKTKASLWISTSIFQPVAKAEKSTSSVKFHKQ